MRLPKAYAENLALHGLAPLIPKCPAHFRERPIGKATAIGSIGYGHPRAGTRVRALSGAKRTTREGITELASRYRGVA